MSRAISLSMSILGLAAAAAAQIAVLAPAPEPKIPFAPERYVIYRAAGPIEVDGELSEPSWQAIEWTRGFRDIQGPSQPEPRHRTVVQMLWDDDFLYIGAFLQEPHLSASLTERDSVIFADDNDFEVFIDPDGDTQDYFELEMNALNTVWDLLLVRPYRDGGPAVSAWDIRGLKTAVALKGTLNDPSDLDKAWTIEIAVPFAALRECIAGLPPRPEAGDQWRMQFSRVEWRFRAENGAYVKMKDAATGRPLPEDNWTWTPQGPINIHYPEMWGFVQFSGKTAGRARDKFVERPEESVKWALRKIYYRERGRAAEGQAFTDDLAALRLAGDKQLRVRGWNFPPRIRATDSLFEAVYENAAGDSWHIRQDGLVWKTAAAKN